MIMRRFFLLLFVILVGFTVNDVQTEFILLDWKKINEFHVGQYGGIDQSFPEAVYPDAPSMVPFFVRSYPVTGASGRFRFIIQNPVFEELEIPGNSSFYEEIPSGLSVRQHLLKSGSDIKIEVQVPAIIRKEGRVMMLKAFELKRIPKKLKSATSEAYSWKKESVLKDGDWIKISTSSKGIYSVPYSILNEWGFSNPSQVKVFGAGGIPLSEDPGEIAYDDLPQLAIWHGTNMGSGALFFYAPGTQKWGLDEQGEYFVHRSNDYTDKGFFFLTEKGGDPLSIPSLSAPEGEKTHAISSFDAYALLEHDKFNLLHSGKQWFGDKFISGSAKRYELAIPGADEGAGISFLVQAAARSSSSSEMALSLNQDRIGEINFSNVNTSDATAVFADLRKARINLPGPDGDGLNFLLEFSGSSSSAEAWLDYIEVNYRRRLTVENEVLFFRDKSSVGAGNILEFSLEGGTGSLKVWDVTDAFQVKEILLQNEGNRFTGKTDAGDLREFAAFNPDGDFPVPQLVGEVENQNLHQMETPEFIIVTHPNFLTHAQQLADFHRSYDGMTVEVVPSEKIYNEFSSGSKSATGIRNFIKMLHDRDEGLKYVLLFGDGSYDNKNIQSGNQAFIPTYQSENSLNPVASFVTDDYFVILDEGESVYNGAVDLGIGRIPASTAFEAQLVLNKILNYYTPETHGSWRNTLCFIADDEDGNLHMRDSERLAGIVNESHNALITDKIYFDAYPQITGPGGESYPAVTDAINERVEEGVLVLNYVGHANERFMADEKVLDISHINSWSNARKLPIFVTATCEFSRFDADESSAGEYILFNANGGGIGLFSTTRLVFAYSNYLLSRSFYNVVFQKDEQGKYLRMGDIIRLSKINTINTTNKRNFSLLADPALRLSLPQNNVITETINGRMAESNPDTLGALQKVTVSGYIADETGNKIENFSGEITPTVFDKAVVRETLGNSGETPMSFEVQENIIYKGLTEVVDGEFSFSFVIPKDIAFSLGEGKIIYYADDGETDAHGAFENFYIGGSGSLIEDNTGPEIQLYLDSPDFQPGDEVSKNPTLVAHLSDENGINTAGTGIGHDITAVLDDDYSNVLVMNNFYQANPGDYTSGTVRYPLKNLLVGSHSLKFKAWDVANNSTEVEIEFQVTDDFEISRFYNYPNPVSDYTFFVFEHNQAGNVLETLFEVFDLNGRRVDAFKMEVGSSSNRSNPVRWDLNELGFKPPGGIYIFRVTARNNDGVIASKSGKMVIGG